MLWKLHFVRARELFLESIHVGRFVWHGCRGEKVLIAGVLGLFATTDARAQKIVAKTGTVITNQNPQLTVAIPPGAGIFNFTTISNTPTVPAVAFTAALGPNDVAGFSDRLGSVELRVRSGGPPFLSPLGSFLQQGKSLQNIFAGQDVTGAAVYKDPGNDPQPSGLTLLGNIAHQGLIAPGTSLPYGNGFGTNPSMNRLGTAAFTGTAGGLSGVWKGDASVSLVALQGNPAPGTGVLNGSVFGGLGVAVINDINNTAFSANLLIPGTPPVPAGNAVYKEAAGGLTLVARTGSPAPGTASTFNVISTAGRQGDVGFNNLGQVAFASTLANGASGVWKETGGPNAPYSLVPVALFGGVAPGTGGATFGGASPLGATNGPFTGPLINGSGATTFVATVGGGTFEAMFTEGVGIGSPGGPTGALSLVARQFMPMPGTPAGGTLTGVFGPSGILGGGGAINASGQVAFYGGWSSPTAAGTGIWMTDLDHTIQPVVVTGQTMNIPGQPQPFTIVGISGAFPVLAGGSAFMTSGGQDGRSSFFNDGGQVVYVAQLAPVGTTTATLEAVVIGGIRPGISADASRNGVVDVFDLNAISAAWGLTGTPGFISADVNFDGIVNIFDWSYVSSHWGQINAPGTGGFSSITVVPEPSTAVLLTLGIVALIAGRRVRRVA